MLPINFEPIDVADALKIIGALGVFGVGLWQYYKAQVWKRREFIAAQIKEFEADTRNRLMMLALDWSDRKMTFPTDDGKDMVTIEVTDELLCGALLHHEHANGFFRNEVIVRDCVDRFLESLVRFENFVDAKLIKAEELRPYLGYWIKLITGQLPDRHSPEVFILLLNYVNKYEFDRVAQLIKHFGYNPTPDPAEIEKAIKATVAHRAQYMWKLRQKRDADGSDPDTPAAG